MTLVLSVSCATTQTECTQLAKVNANDWYGKAPMSASTLGGQTLNPHHLDYVPGGSSCGTGAALAAKYAPLGLGTDASGSVLMPAAHSSAKAAAGRSFTAGPVPRPLCTRWSCPASNPSICRIVG